MWIAKLITISVLAGLPAGLMAQTESAPLSAIDWLNQNAPLASLQQAHLPKLDEPPVTETGRVPTVAVTPLETQIRRRLGLLPRAITGLPPDMWTDTAPEELKRRLDAALGQRLPAAQELLLMVLLAEADDPPNPDAAIDWLAARLDTLITIGAVDPGLALVSQADPTRDKALFSRWMTLSLLSKNEYGPCQVLTVKPVLRPDEASHVYCSVQSGDFSMAALLFGNAAALGMFGDVKEPLLAHFLDPELFADTELPRPPVRPDALTFRLFEAAGSPLPTAPLPVAFAHSDLSEDAGWKAQLEAAERLSRAGVLPSNQILGLYTDRKPAASGGIWDRVSALQKFEAALDSGNAEAVSRALPAMWRGMQAAGLETVFSELFAARLNVIPVSGPAKDLAYQMSLLSRTYEMGSPPGGRRNSFLKSVASGSPAPENAESNAEKAVALGFAMDAPVTEEIKGRRSTQLGGILLGILDRLADAGRGDLDALTHALADLRAVGMTDMSRRVALQYLILQDDL